MKFWDTSALFTLLTAQHGGTATVEVFSGDREIAIWWGTPVELTSAAARLHRMGEISDDDYSRILAQIGPLSQHAEEIQPTNEVRQTAERLVRVHELRSADALQLAAALVWAGYKPTGVGFVCLDSRLRLAAQKEGFSVLG